MKIVEQIDLIKRGLVPASRTWHRACSDVRQAIAATDWPRGTGKFVIYPESGKKRGMGNGVDLIKVPCIQKLKDLGWEVECLPPIKSGTLTTGDLDAVLQTKAGSIAFEWETGDGKHLIESSCYQQAAPDSHDRRNRRWFPRCPQR